MAWSKAARVGEVPPRTKGPVTGREAFANGADDPTARGDAPDGGSAMPCGLVLPAARAKLVAGDLAAGGAAGGVVVLVDLVGAAVHDPDVADVGSGRS